MGGSCGVCYNVGVTTTAHDSDAANENPEQKPGPYSFAALKEAFTDFLADDSLTQAAAVAYYTALSFAPLLVLTTLIVGTLLGESTKQRVVEEVQALMGPGVGESVEQVMQAEEGDKRGGQQLDKVKSGGFGTLTGIIGIIALVYSASGVFAQLQAALNKIWDVEAKPGEGVLGYLRKRFLSVGIVFAILFLLLASLAVSTVLNAVVGGDGIGWRILNFGVSLVVYVALFALIFKYLPDVTIPWKAVIFGACVTAVLFAVGKWAIGLYLARGDVGGSYGGAGSVVVLLVWVYYSAVILFLGAELTQVWAKYSGLRIEPDKHAQPETAKQKTPAHGQTA